MGSFPLDLVFVLDTTASMSSVLYQARKELANMTNVLFKDIHNLRVAIIAQGDYNDKYEVLLEDFSDDTDKLTGFINNVSSTCGYDWEECYELSLQRARTHLNWRMGASKALVVVGDSVPHPLKKNNKYNIDWKQELELLKQMGVTIYGVSCSKHNLHQEFMKTLTDQTGGVLVMLSAATNIMNYLMTIAYREGGVLPNADLVANMHSDVNRDRLMLTKSVSIASTDIMETSKSATNATPKKKPSLIKRKVTKPTLKHRTSVKRIQRESFVHKCNVAPLNKMKFSSWKLVMKPGSPSSTSWRSINSGCHLKSHLFNNDTAKGMKLYELSVQRHPGSKHVVLFSRLLNQRATVSNLLSRRRKVRAQITRVLSMGMKLYARWAVYPNLKTEKVANETAKLKKSVSYAWNSGRCVRVAGAALSVSSRTLGI